MSLLKRIEKKETPTNGGTNNPPGTGPLPAESARQRQTPAPPTDKLAELRARLLSKIIAELDPKLDIGHSDDLRRNIEELFNRFLSEEPDVVLGRIERQRLLEQLTAEIMGFGPLEPLLRDNSIDEIMVNGPNMIYIERQGKIERVAARFDSEMHVYRIIDRIVAPLGRRVDEGQPFVDARLPNGSRVNVIIPPLALNGPTITIRKFATTPLTADDLVKHASFSQEFTEFVKACVTARLNIVVSGGTGTGKTTLLNILSGYIPSDERIITIEDAAELQLRQEHVITLESRPKNIEGKGEITRGDLVVNALRMRPDRILVGECRSAEALDMLQAMNTGHEGSMTTVHANSPRDALHRLETMVLMAGFDLPLKAIREQISSAIDVIIQLERMRDGTRKVVNVSEVQGMEGDVIITQEVYRWETSGMKDGKVQGYLKATGIRPKFIERIEALGIYLQPSIFGLDSRFYQ
ncbi:MAG: CpaF family protein [Chloroflexota bacterium]|nr:MAG: CpaF family protein [Chloroflexota bacterium]